MVICSAKGHVSTAALGRLPVILSVMNRRYISGAREALFALPMTDLAFDARDGEAETLSAL